MKLPIRKHTRLRNFDYSSTGMYFITICTHDRKCILSNIVGRGLAPAETNNECQNNQSASPLSTISAYTDYGIIAEKQLHMLENRYPFLIVRSYVIMPNHIHMILQLCNHASGAEVQQLQPAVRPTIMDIICAYKSLTTRECKRIRPIDRLFQTSFYEHIIRDKDDYAAIMQYIHDNPVFWNKDRFYSTEQR